MKDLSQSSSKLWTVGFLAGAGLTAALLLTLRNQHESEQENSAEDLLRKCDAAASALDQRLNQMHIAC